MNIFTTCSELPRRSQIALAAEIIKRQRATIGELAQAAGVDANSVRGWLGMRSKENTVLTSVRTDLQGLS